MLQEFGKLVSKPGTSGSQHSKNHAAGMLVTSARASVGLPRQVHQHNLDNEFLNSRYAGDELASQLTGDSTSVSLAEQSSSKV